MARITEETLFYQPQRQTNKKGTNKAKSNACPINEWWKIFIVFAITTVFRRVLVGQKRKLMNIFPELSSVMFSHNTCEFKILEHLLNNATCIHIGLDLSS